MYPASSLGSRSLHGGSSAASWICLAAAVVLAFALVLPTGFALFGARASNLRPSVSSSSLPSAPFLTKEGFKAVTSSFPTGDRAFRQVPLESLALSHAKTGDYTVANTLLADSKRRRDAAGVSGPSGVSGPVVPGPFADKAQSAAGSAIIATADKAQSARRSKNQSAVMGWGSTNKRGVSVPASDPGCPADLAINGFKMVDGKCTAPSKPVIDRPPPGWIAMSLVTALKFDGVPIDRAWLSGNSRENTGEGWTGSANGGKQVSLLDAFLGADGTVSAGGTRRKVHRMVYCFSGNGVVEWPGDGHTYELGKLALYAHMAEKPVGSNGDALMVRYFGSINKKGELDLRAYSEVSAMAKVDTWAFRRVNVATGAKSFCMFTEPKCTKEGRGPEKTSEFVIYTSKAGGPEGVATSQELNALGTTCTKGGVIENHKKDMAWWSFD